MNDKIENVPRRRLKLQAKAQDLYPQDYDLESLFTDFHERKKLKDIERGSKKRRNNYAKRPKKSSKTRQIRNLTEAIQQLNTLFTCYLSEIN